MGWFKGLEIFVGLEKGSCTKGNKDTNTYRRIGRRAHLSGKSQVRTSLGIIAFGNHEEVIYISTKVQITASYFSFLNKTSTRRGLRLVQRTFWFSSVASQVQSQIGGAHSGVTLVSQIQSHRRPFALLDAASLPEFEFPRARSWRSWQVYSVGSAIGVQ